MLPSAILKRRITLKWIVSAIILVASASFADEGPEFLKFKNGVTFPHRSHQNFLKSDCRNCHKKELGPGKIPTFGKDIAHRMCKTCHAIRQAGPSACKDCHKK
jgi:hypothetical protein